MKLPKYLKKYFWNVYFENLDTKKNQDVIIGKILEYGNEKAVGWMFKIYSEEHIKKVFQQTRGFTFLKNAYFWKWYFNLPEENVKCLQKDYLKQQRAIWPY